MAAPMSCMTMNIGADDGLDAGEAVGQRAGDRDRGVGEAGRGREPVGAADPHADREGDDVARPLRTQPWITSSRPTVATTSDSHSAPDERGVVDQSMAGSSNIRFATHGAEAAADDLGDDVEAGVAGGDRAEPRSTSVTTGLKCAPETAPNMKISPIRAPPVAAAFSSSCSPTSSGDEAAGHDPGADDGDDQQPGAQRLGDEAAGQVECERAGAGLDGSRAEVVLITRRRERADPVAQFVDRGIERRPAAGRDRVGDRPVQPGRVGVELLVGLVADRDHQRRQLGDVVEQLGRAPVRSSPARRAPAIAPGWTRSAGWVPAMSAGR